MIESRPDKAEDILTTIKRKSPIFFQSFFMGGMLSCLIYHEAKNNSFSFDLLPGMVGSTAVIVRYIYVSTIFSFFCPFKPYCDILVHFFLHETTFYIHPWNLAIIGARYQLIHVIRNFSRYNFASWSIHT